MAWRTPSQTAAGAAAKAVGSTRRRACSVCPRPSFLQWVHARPSCTPPMARRSSTGTTRSRRAARPPAVVGVPERAHHRRRRHAERAVALPRRHARPIRDVVCARSAPSPQLAVAPGPPASWEREWRATIGQGRATTASACATRRSHPHGTLRALLRLRLRLPPPPPPPPPRRRRGVGCKAAPTTASSHTVKAAAATASSTRASSAPDPARVTIWRRRRRRPARDGGGGGGCRIPQDTPSTPTGFISDLGGNRTSSSVWAA